MLFGVVPLHFLEIVFLFRHFVTDDLALHSKPRVRSCWNMLETCWGYEL